MTSLACLVRSLAHLFILWIGEHPFPLLSKTETILSRSSSSTPTVLLQGNYRTLRSKLISILVILKGRHIGVIVWHLRLLLPIEVVMLGHTHDCVEHTNR